MQLTLFTDYSLRMLIYLGVRRGEHVPIQEIAKIAHAAGAKVLFDGAQGIVHLGIDLEDVPTKASLSDAIEMAFRRLGLQVVRRGT